MERGALIWIYRAHPSAGGRLGELDDSPCLKLRENTVIANEILDIPHDFGIALMGVCCLLEQVLTELRRDRGGLGVQDKWHGEKTLVESVLGVSLQMIPVTLIHSIWTCVSLIHAWDMLTIYQLVSTMRFQGI